MKKHTMIPLDTIEVEDVRNYIFSECDNTLILENNEMSEEIEQPPHYFKFSVVHDQEEPFFPFQEAIPISNQCYNIDENQNYQFSEISLYVCFCKEWILLKN